MTDRDDQLADLLVLWDDARAAGRPLTPQSLCGDTPNLLAPFTELLRRLGRVDPVLNGTAAIGPEVEVIDAGRFAPLAFHDEGGLGVVYVAEDAELKRVVALKWMKPGPGLDPHARRRFLQEAELTGKLEHPGVPPVYGAGHDPRGRPYYAMRFIRGTTFGDAIERVHALSATDPARPVEFARLLRAFVSVCQTVACAHARNVIHRDLKPGNIMLGPYGETLVVDWGLAKRIDPPDPRDGVGTGYAPVDLHLAAPAGSSVYGQVKGSPAYMAPEQARGQAERIGPAADVYALGATLYALLSGRAPYTGSSAGEVIERVKRTAPPPPRTVTAGVPRPLDAICARAMSRDPADRYPSPKQLAEDVEKWCADEPVSAYRDPPAARARRWVKRHHTAATTGLAALLVGGAALAVVVPLLAAKNRELTERKNHLERANAELVASSAARRTDFEAADTGLRAVMDGVFARAAVGEDPLTRRLRAAAILRYRDYLNGFIARNAAREDVRLEVALARLKVGEVDGIVGQADAALASHA